MKFFSKLLVVQFILAMVLMFVLYPFKLVYNNGLPETVVGSIQYTYQKQTCLKASCYTSHYADMRYDDGDTVVHGVPITRPYPVGTKIKTNYVEHLKSPTLLMIEKAMDIIWATLLMTLLVMLITFVIAKIFIRNK